MKMKRNWWKRAAGITLAFTLTMGGLTACGGKKGDPMANAALAKENVYRYQEIDFPDLGGDDSNVYATYVADGKVYMLMQVYHWSDAPNENKLLVMNTDGSDIKVMDLEMPAEKNHDMFAAELNGEDADRDADEETPDGEEDADVRIPAGTEDADEDTPDGSEDAEEDTSLDDEADVDIDGDFALDYDPDYDDWYTPPDIWENTSFGSYSFGKDRIFALEYYYYEDNKNNFTFRKTYVCSWDLDGALLWETELENLQTDESYVYVSGIVGRADGSLLMIMSGDECYMQSVAADGTMGAKKALSAENADIFNYYQYILPKKDGTLVVVYADRDEWTKMYLAVFDPEKEQLGEAKRLPESFAWYGYNSLSAGLNSDLLYSDSNGVYILNAGDEAGTKKMDFINSDLGISYFNNLVELDENTFIGTYYDENYETKAGIFTYVRPEDIPDKRVLVLAGNNVDYNIRRRVIDFNRNSDEYRITIKTYDYFRTQDDWQAGYAKLNNDIVSGNMPDILIAEGLPVDNYIAKGLLADIGKMIENDEELSKVEFVQNVFDAYSVNGKLYYVIPSFHVRTLIGKTSLVGDRTSWTMEDMQKLQDSLPEGSSMLGTSYVRSDFFDMMMHFCGAEFIDVDTGKCDFDTPGFIGMMKFAKNMPSELDDDFWMNYDWQAEEARYRENKTVLYYTYIGSISDMNSTINGLIGDDISFIGFPSQSGQGSVVGMNSAYCISARSANQEAAWEFLRYYLTDEYQDTLEWQLPVQKDKFEELAQNATQRPFYIDYETGEKVEYDDYFYMNGERIMLEPMSQEQVDQIVNFIYTVDKPVYNNQNVMNIINEEMESFFSGQKSAEDVAAIIQNRAQVYVDENR